VGGHPARYDTGSGDRDGTIRGAERPAGRAAFFRAGTQQEEGQNTGGRYQKVVTGARMASPKAVTSHRGRMVNGRRLAYNAALTEKIVAANKRGGVPAGVSGNYRRSNKKRGASAGNEYNTGSGRDGGISS